MKKRLKEYGLELEYASSERYIKWAEGEEEEDLVQEGFRKDVRPGVVVYSREPLRKTDCSD